MHTPTDTDRLDRLFAEFKKEETLPGGFRNRLMEQVRREAVRLERRKERRGIYAAVAASVALVAAAVTICWIFMPEALPASPEAWKHVATEFVPSGRIEFSWPAIRFPHAETFGAALYLGGLFVALLGFDCVLRTVFRKHRQKSTPKEL